ncbi:MAG: GntR family transcriptional regulator [Candidatus Bipolaricaulota bacterium]|nr:GntR family transcriptional regulator [Candidatus Bipolaricaulota bacterium]MDW8127193.1 GntR family transcriptional regulator [Candidatus Bipolaricaulota bacterium]
MYRLADVITESCEALQRSSPVPLYYQLKEIFRSWIIAGRFNSGERFPSESALQKHFQVSRMTIRRALTELVNEGFLIRERGRGSFVVRPRVQSQLRRLTSFTEDMQLRGLRADSKFLDFCCVRDAEAARKMGVAEDEELVQIRRLRLVEGEPVALQNAYVRHALCPGIVEKGLIEGSLYKTIEDGYGLKLGRALQTVEAKPADEYEAGLLGIGVGQPVLILERLTYLANGEPVEYVRSSFRGDRYRFVIELVR